MPTALRWQKFGGPTPETVKPLVNSAEYREGRVGHDRGRKLDVKKKRLTH